MSNKYIFFSNIHFKKQKEIKILNFINQNMKKRLVITLLTNYKSFLGILSVNLNFRKKKIISFK